MHSGDTMNPSAGALKGSWQSGIFASVNYHYFIAPPAQWSKGWCILLHGHPGCSHSWHHAVPFLQEHGYGIILPDMLGYGGTDKPLDVHAYRASKVVESMDALLASVIGEGQKVIAIGHDWGSTIAARLHLRKQGRVQALVMLSVPYLPPSPTRFDCDAFNAFFRPQVGYDILDYFKFFSSPEAPALLTTKIDSFLSIIFAKDTPRVWQERWANGDGMQAALNSDMKFEIAEYMTEEDLKIYRNELGDGTYAARLNWYKSFYLSIQQDDDLDLVGERAHIHIPTIFFQGLRDAVCIPQVAMAQRDFINDLTVIEVDSDHFIMEGTPAQFHAALLSWFEAKGL
ncbi:hypothetical protein VKT23_009565 [Stygiomarasmius scandens]|uniref:AB hydrolase-1 domain-containing protein n=1 Tax=Marasmiellus scandens TaxID=2682957 RepID=A0ABR1JGU8_9AGAR